MPHKPHALEQKWLPKRWDALATALPKSYMAQCCNGALVAPECRWLTYSNDYTIAIFFAGRPLNASRPANEAPALSTFFPIVFSDLDGTLLSHEDYSFASAVPALERLRQRHIPVIFNSSKTWAELQEIRAALNNHHPVVVENGSAIIVPKDCFGGYAQATNIIILGPKRSQLLAIIQRLRQQGRYSFQGFADFTVAELARETGLSVRQAEKAKDRLSSEPIRWLGDRTALLRFKDALQYKNLRLVKGGRFWHVMGQTDKRKGMDWLTEQYKRREGRQIRTIALGDSENDRAMLENADVAAVVRRHDGSHLFLEKSSSPVIHTEQQAPDGWREAIDQALKLIDMEAAQ